MEQKLNNVLNLADNLNQVHPVINSDMSVGNNSKNSDRSKHSGPSRSSFLKVFGKKSTADASDMRSAASFTPSQLDLPEKSSRLTSATTRMSDFESINARPSAIERETPELDLETIKEVVLKNLPEKSVSEFLVSENTFKKSLRYENVSSNRDDNDNHANIVESYDFETMAADEIEEIDLFLITRDGNSKLLEQLIYHSRNQRPWIDFAKQLNKLDDKGMSPLHYAAKFNQIDCAKVILDFSKHNEKVNNSLEYSYLYKLPGKDDTLPIHTAAKYLPKENRNVTDANNNLKEQSLTTLKSTDSDVASPSTQSITKFGSKTVSKLWKTKPPKNVLELFMRTSKKEEWFFANKANILSVADSYGQSIIHFSVQRDNLEAVEMIINHFETPDMMIHRYSMKTPSVTRRSLAQKVDTSMITPRSTRAGNSVFNKSSSEGFEKAPLIQKNSGDLANMQSAVAGSIALNFITTMRRESTAIASNLGGLGTGFAKTVLESGRTVLESVKLVGPDAEEQKRKNTERCKMLKKLAINQIDKSDMTPLHYAATYNKHEIAKFLIEEGADILAQDTSGDLPIHMAAREGHKKVVDVLLDGKFLEKVYAFEKMEMDWSDVLMAQCFNTEQHGQRAIHFALENRRFEAVQLILERCLEYFGKDVVYKLANDHGGREDGNTPLHICAAAGGEKSVYLLKEIYKVSARKQNKASATPLFLASQLGHTKVVMRLVDLDNPKKTSEYLRKKNRKGASPLLAAVANGHVETVKVLLKLGSNVKSTNTDDQNVFYIAAEQNHPKVLQTLIENNEKIADELMVHPDHKGNTAFHIAARLGHESIMDILIEIRLKYDKSDTKSNSTGLESLFQFEFDAMANHNGQTPLHMACKQGNEKITLSLVGVNSSLMNDDDMFGDTPLHIACTFGHLNCAKILLENNSNVSCRNSKKWAPLDCAAAHGYADVCKLLLEYDSECNPTDLRNQTPLMLACKEGHVDVVNLLLDNGGKVNITTRSHLNCLDYAIIHQQEPAAMAIVKSDQWKHALRSAFIEGENLQTPFRRAIAIMPNVAEYILSRCIESEDASPSNVIQVNPDDEDADASAKTVLLNFEFLDDSFSAKQWLPRQVGSQDLHANDIYDKETGKLRDENEEEYSDDIGSMLDNHPLTLMVNHDRKKLLLHPLVSRFLSFKWGTVGRRMAWLDLGIYLIFLICFNLFMCSMAPWWAWDPCNEKWRIYNNESIANGDSTDGLGPRHYQQWWAVLTQVGAMDASETSGFENCVGDTFCFPQEKTLNYVLENICPVLSYVCFIVSLVRMSLESIQLYNSGVGYFNEVQNILELVVYGSAMIISINTYRQDLTMYGFTGECVADNTTETMGYEIFGATTPRNPYVWNIAIIGVMLSWLVLLMFIRIISNLGVYVLMMMEVFKTVAEFVSVLILFMMSFAVGFYLLFGQLASFSTLNESLQKTAVMMIGEFEYSDMFGHVIVNKLLHRLFFYFFMVVMSIVVVNLMVGLAVDDIDGVRKEAGTIRVKMRSDQCLSLEFMIFASWVNLRGKLSRKFLRVREKRTKVSARHFKAQIKYFFCATENDIQIERDAIMELDVENSKSSKMVKEI